MYRTVFLNNIFWVFFIGLASCSENKAVEQLPFYNSPDFTPTFVSAENNIEQQIAHKIAPFSLTNQYGQQITQQDVDEKIHVANFIFTKCGSICPVMTKHMKLVQEAFKNDPGIVLLSYSVTPWIDSVPRLKKYAENNGISSSNWHFLTGPKAAIYTLARRSYFAEEALGFTKDSTEFLHTEHILLVDKKRRIRGIYNGTLQLEIEQLVNDINLLKKD
jgi:protein SCO1/2